MLFLSYLVLYCISILSILLIFKGFLRGKVNAYYFIIPLLLIFYVLPEVLDFMIGTKFTGPSFTYVMYDALVDDHTSIFYNFYIATITLFFTFLMYKSNSINYNNITAQLDNFSKYYTKFKFLYWILLLTPILLVFYTGNIDFYSQYIKTNRSEGPEIQGTIGKLVLISTVISTLVNTHYIKKIRDKKSLKYLIPIIFILLISILNFYLHGKRSIVITFLTVQLTTLFISRAVSRRALLYIGAVATLLGISFLSFYGKNVGEGTGITGFITGLRVDLSRDYVVKFVIYNDLFNDNHILPFRGASYLFLLLFFIPRAIYPDKPQPYAVYFTNSAFGNFGGDYWYGWGLTTSAIAESISNLGWLGLIVFPVFYALIIRYIKNINSIPTHLLTYFILGLLLVIEPIAIMVPLLLLIFLLIKRNKKIVWRVR